MSNIYLSVIISLTNGKDTFTIPLHDFPFVGTQESQPTVVESKMTKIWLRRVINFFEYTQA